MDEFGALRILVKVSESGSFSAAARDLSLQPSSVSRQIAALEDRLGVPLFRRNSRTMRLTEAGRIYVAQCKAILGDLRRANEIVSGMQTAAHGRLVVETRAGLGVRLIAPLLPMFLERHPQLRVQLHLSDHTSNALRDGVDVAIRFGLGGDGALLCKRIAQTRRIVFASPDYLRRYGRPQTPQDLLQHNCLGFASSTGELAQWRFSGDAGETLLEVRGNLVANDVSALIAAANAGLGVCVLHEWMIWDDLRSGRLERILESVEVSTLEQFETPIYAVYRAGRLPAKVRVFVDYLCANLTPSMPMSR